MLSLQILTQSYWRDEAFTIFQASANIPQMLRFITWDSSPPFYYVILHFWMKVFGDGEIATRTLSVIFHLATSVFSYLILKKILNKKIFAWLGSLVVFLNPFLLFYAAETRPYAFFTFLVIGSVWAYLNKRYKLFSGLLALMVLTHNFSLFFIGSFVLFFLWQKKPLKVFLAPLVALIVWLPIFLLQLARVRSGFWIGPLNPKFLIDSLELFFEGYGEYKFLQISYGLVLILIVLGISAKVVRKDKAKLLAVLYFGPVLTTALVSALVVPLFIERYLLPALPILIIWITAGIFELKTINRWVYLAAVGLGTGYLFFLFFGDLQMVQTESKTPIRQAVQEIMLRIKPNEVIISDSELNFLETKYYAAKINKQIPVWVHFAEGKDKLPYYLGWPFFQDAVFVARIPEFLPAWVIKSDGRYFYNLFTKD